VVARTLVLAVTLSAEAKTAEQAAAPVHHRVQRTRKTTRKLRPRQMHSGENPHAIHTSFLASPRAPDKEAPLPRKFWNLEWLIRSIRDISALADAGDS
jgi:hypothetical protein